MPAEEDPRPSQIIDAIANGMRVDWTSWQDAGDSAETGGGILSALQVIAAIAEFHRGHNPDDPAATLGDALNAADVPVADPRGQPDLSKGEPWGPLIVLERIDGGSFGDVFRAWDPALAKVVALKRSRYSSAADAARAALEARRLANIPPHPNVITVYGACNINGVVGIWMEFLRGRTLQRLVNDEGELGWVEATHYGECLCRALSHIHGAMTLHRDVKAANVMKAAGGRIVLIDFGSGDEIAPIGAHEPARIVGTLPYMAPELLEGRPATPQSDIYSLGVLLFNLVTGSYPVSGGSRGDFGAAHRSGRRRLLSDVRSDLPMPFVRVVERAIAPDPEQRYRTAGEFLNDLVPSAPPPGAAAAIGKSSIAARARTVVWFALGVGSAVTGLGMVNSRFFNAALGRSDFTNETLWDWLGWGAASMVAPAVLCTVALVALALAVECGPLLVSRWRWAAVLSQRIGGTVRRYQLDDVSSLASCALLGSAVALVSAWWYFAYHEPTIGRLIAVSSPDISWVSGPILAFLSPQHIDQHQLYRKSFVGVIIVTVVLWYPAIRLAMQHGEPINRGILTGGAAVLILSLLLLDFPYRLLASWESRSAFDEVRWRGANCFILGERQIDLLLFCPGEGTPRNKIVRKSDPDLEDLHRKRDIFTDVGTLK